MPNGGRGGIGIGMVVGRAGYRFAHWSNDFPPLYSKTFLVAFIASTSRHHPWSTSKNMYGQGESESSSCGELESDGSMPFEGWKRGRLARSEELKD